MYQHRSEVEDITNIDVLITNVPYFDKEELNYLKLLKSRSPSTAFIICSERYVEMLSFWSLRNKIMDYVIFPQEREYLHNLLASLDQLNRVIQQESRKPLFFETEPNSYKNLNSCESAKLKTEKAIKHISENYQKKIRVDTLAAECNYSVTAFCSIFKRENGKSAMEYLNCYRVNKAKKLLSDTLLSVSSIAHHCGFEDVSYFVKVFKHCEEVTPSRYRKSL